VSTAANKSKGGLPRASQYGLGAIGLVTAIMTALGGMWVGLVVLSALVGTPLFAVMGGASELAWLLHPSDRYHHLRFIAPEILASRFAGSPIITTIPLFTFTGYLMAESKTPERLVRAATTWVGWLPGGLAIVCVVASAVFTLFTGGSGVTIIAVGGLLYPALRREGYSEKFSLGLVTTGGSVGLLLPYSLPLLVFALVSGLDINLAFKAVVAPGVLVLVMLAAYSAYVGVKEKVPRTPFEPVAAAKAMWNFKWEMGIPVILVVGMKTGLAQIDECAALVAFYTFVVEVFIYKDLSIKKDIVRIAKSSMSLAGAVILILAMANALINYVVQEQIPGRVLDAMLKLGLDKPWQFLIVMNVFLLVLGMVMDGFSAILVAVPLVLPFAAYFGLGPFHVAIMFVLNLELAFVCPPLGLNIFISSFRFNRPVISLYKVVLPFAAILGIALFLVTYIPSISNMLVVKDIDEKRLEDEKRGFPPKTAWRLECVQNDPSNPLPCSEADKKKYPGGQMPAPAVTAEVKVVPDAGAGEEEDLAALIGGKKPEAKDAAVATGNDEDDLAAMISGSGAKDAGADAPAAKPDAPKAPVGEDDFSDFISGKKDGG
jgi:tripartite ATP-independent transporter DctM subunit